MTRPSLRVIDASLSESEKRKYRQDTLVRGFFPEEDGRDFSAIFADEPRLPDTVGQKNCENWVGSVPLPVGVAGPIDFFWTSLNLSDSNLVGDKKRDKKSVRNCFIPLATTEGALVASVSRGCKALLHDKESLPDAKDAKPRVYVDKKGMTRAPVFACSDTATAFRVEQYITTHRDQLAQVAASTSGHLQLLDVLSWIRGRHVYVRFAFDTDLAMGMNMVTIATQRMAEMIVNSVPDVSLLALSSNVCTDKKDNVINSLLGRGYWVQAEARLSAEAISTVLKTTVEKLLVVHMHKNLIGSNLAGSLSQNAHTANVVSAIFLATGQDPAHVVEGSKAFLSLEADGDGLYAALTLPNLNVGTVGGGTSLPAQTQARTLMGIHAGEAQSAGQLAATVGVAALAGELSLLSSLAEHTLACAHQQLGRVSAATTRKGVAA